MALGAGTRRGFGQVSQLRSGRYQARWRFSGRYYTARTVNDQNHDLGPRTFSTAKKAEDYLAWVHQEIEAGRWKPPVKSDPQRDALFRDYADEWVRTRRNRNGLPLKPRTVEHYRDLLDRLIYPTLGATSLPDVATRETFEGWYYSLDVKASPVQTAHAYDLVRSILRTAHKAGLVVGVPEIDGASATKRRRRRMHLLSLDELAALTAAMPEKYRLMVTLYAWCAVRFGELTALRKRDINLRDEVIHVERGVTFADGEWHEDTPKSGEGGDVEIPPHIMQDVKSHIRSLKADDLLFPAAGGGYMAKSTFHTVFNTAKKRIGRPDIRPHDLRHLGSVLAASAGASPAELMERLRHKTAQASQIYWHVAQGRGRQIADRMSELAAEQTNVVPIETAKRPRKRKESST